MRCVLEFNENTKEVEIKGEKIASELRIQAVKQFDIDITKYTIQVDGVKINNNYDNTEDD